MSTSLNLSMEFIIRPHTLTHNAFGQRLDATSSYIITVFAMSERGSYFPKKDYVFFSFFAPE